MSINKKKLSTLAWGGDDNVGGIIHTEIYIAEAAWFAANGIKEIPTHLGATDMASLAKVVGDHTFLTGYGFMKITATPKTGNIESSTLGELDGKVKNNVFAFMIPGSDAEVLGFERMLMNKDLICLVKEQSTKEYRQIGSACIPARIETVTNTLGGGTYEGKKGSSFEIHDFGPVAAPIYPGLIYVATESSAS
jgi:hypothetical protein